MVKLFKVGQIVNVQGIRGEIRVYPLTDYKERFEELEFVYIEDSDKKFYIDHVKYKNNLVLLKFKGIDDRNEAEKLKTKYLMIDEEDRRELPEDTYYISDLIGIKVYTEDKVLVGEVKNIIQNTAQDLYEIVDAKNPKKTILIPAVGEFIKEVDIQNKTMTIATIEGLIE
ncbi:ribosome maturation factor RimM [Inediibacterium massiliense]|uniref:ribosome maturation factor RimM n=1 Tax=Inediibacterium massiliense TaxID=1658111 RepID=UPI0006B42C61|nr:ribosome maturation factor RimM [Inediibacterium massiliense]